MVQRVSQTKESFKRLHIEVLEFIINNAFFAFILYHLSKIFKPKLKTSITNIAFIMDGNRRYSKKNGISDIAGKTAGFNKMLEICNYCQYLGMKEASFFAFSLSNFKRNKCEVDGVMDLIKMRKKDLKDLNIKINVFGRRDVLEDEIRETFDELMDMYKGTEFAMNLFFAYSSLDEIENISYKHPVDLLVRTSGEKRLSDFLLYQCANGTRIFFCNSLWPNLSLLQLWLIIYKCEVERRYYA